ncbi:hypothetical protein NTE_00841 [Candidatus Nitrososphaera evergladensis SR1]|jgi:hypothetical protein|uniref:Uncharacterized protein n=1 Tax=Candidatus Nitrososphaera evergladensis SR1 TaxID=1459636 RepID=A0A075MPX5_9ARCH|nr:hypothetical protein [Candidatus Nitrososphaera evergladensis]AIF82917.1 hypothetical protein NTE_00841 [Candidatus Nitrososphaera evergladensis SR1]
MKETSGAPKDGHERIVADRDGGKHLEYFRNGSWRHDATRCKAKINKECRK